jgi:hypothetical protein
VKAPLKGARPAAGARRNEGFRAAGVSERMVCSNP